MFKIGDKVVLKEKGMAPKTKASWGLNPEMVFLMSEDLVFTVRVVNEDANLIRFNYSSSEYSFSWHMDDFKLYSSKKIGGQYVLVCSKNKG